MNRSHLNLISIKNFKYFHPRSNIVSFTQSRNTLQLPSSNLSRIIPSPWTIERKKRITYILERRNNFSIQLSSGDLNSIGGSLPGGGDIYIYIDDPESVRDRASRILAWPTATRDIYRSRGREGIEASKRRTLDTTRHLTCSAARLRKPLSGVSYLFRDTVLRDPIGARSPLSLSLSSHRLPAPHPHSISPFESRRRPLSLSRPSVRPSVRPRSACDSKPQDTCCIACLLAVHPHADLRPRVHARTRRSLLRVDFCHLRLVFFLRN